MTSIAQGTANQKESQIAVHQKGQLVGNQDARIEALMGLLSGMAYGLVNPLVSSHFYKYA